MIVMTYNIRSGRNMAGDLNIAHAAQTISDLAPDIVGLNEVRSHSADVGPVNQALIASGWTDKAIDFLNIKISVRVLISLMNFLMWFGNTTILLMAGIQGIDQSLFEAAEIDGANSVQVFFRVTLPLLSPVMVYTVITAMIGGLQMFDVPQILTNGKGTPERASMTVVMYLNNYLTTSKNYGMAGAVSVILFVVSAALSLFVYSTLSKQYRK